MKRMDRQFGLGGWLVIILLIIGPILLAFSSQVYLAYESEATQYVEVTEERTVQEGDKVNIDFEGTVVGESEPFEGGTAIAYDLVIGSDTFIPGFEDAIIGHSVGETFTFSIPFPEEYADAELAGKDANWVVTINSISEEQELSFGEWVQTKFE